MAYTPYDWQQTLRQRADYVEDRLRGGSPVVGISCQEGILLLTTCRTQTKIFEVYDRLAFAGLGAPSDLEAVRHAAVDFAHAEGYQRSEQDVSIQRVVGFAISPALKRTFADPFRTPLVLRGLFAQIGEQPREDVFYMLNYDGEFTLYHRWAVIAGMGLAQRHMERVLAQALGEHGEQLSEKAPTLQDVLPCALEAWASGRWATQAAVDALHGEDEQPEEELLPTPEELQNVLTQALKEETLEAALLERDPRRERVLRRLKDEELEPFLPKAQGEAEG
jgi:proteasome alpha subunit